MISKGGTAMPQLLIRNLDEETIRSLKERAKRHSRSLQGEVKLILEEYASRPDESPLAIADRWQGYFAGRTFSDSSEQVRQDRER
jgi:plasmid stability protein